MKTKVPSPIFNTIVAKLNQSQPFSILPLPDTVH